MIYSSAESTPFLSPIGLNERTFQAHRNGSKMRAQSRTHLAELFVSQKEMKASIEAFFFAPVGVWLRLYVDSGW